MATNCFLPPKELSWTANDAYNYFILHILEGLEFKKKKINTLQKPIRDGYNNGFHHLVTRENNNRQRVYDMERIFRIKWIVSIIKNHNSCSVSTDCTGINIWEYHSDDARNNTKLRTKIFCSKEKYLIILEERPTNYLIISAYIVNDDWMLDKIKKEITETKNATAK